MSDEKSVSIVIRGKNLSGPEFEQARKQIVGLTGEADKAGTAGAALGTPFKLSFGTIAAAGTVAIGAIAGVGAAVVSLGQRGSQILDIQGSFNRLSRSIGETGDMILSVTRTATKGLISDFDVMQAANKGILLGLPITAKEMGTLGTSAIALGKAMGVGPTQALSDLITGLGRGSAAILDNLGITLKAEEAYERYAVSVGKKASALTDGEKKLAIYKAATEAAAAQVDALGGIHLTAADKVQVGVNQLLAWRDEVAKGVASSGVLGEALDGVTTAIVAGFGGDKQGLVKMVVRAIEDAVIMAVEFTRRILDAQIGLNNFFASVFETASKIPGVGDVYGQWAAKIRETTHGWAGMRDTLVQTRQRMDEARAKQQQLTMANDAGDAAVRRIVASTQAQSDALKRAAAETERARKEWDNYKAAFDGRRLFEEADKVVKVVTELGGVTGLTAAEAAKLNGPLEEALDKYRALGVAAPADVFAVTLELDGMITRLKDARSHVELLGLKFETELSRPLLSNNFDPTRMLEPLKRAVVSQGPGIGASLGQSIGQGLLQTFGNMGSTFAQAFTGGGGLSGAFKALGVQLADNIVKPLMERLSKLSVGRQAAIGVGVGGAALIGGAAAGGAGAMVGQYAGLIGGAALQMSGLVTSTVALGAATAGIGAAAVGVYLLAKHWFGVSKEIKETRAAVEEYQTALHNTLDAQQRQEAGNERWRMTLVAVRDAFEKVGYSAETAEDLVGKMLNTDDPGQARQAMQAINTVMQEYEARVTTGRTLFSELMDTMARGGQAVPPQLQGMVDRLLEIGAITKDDAAAFASLANAVPSVQAVEEAAKALNMDLNALGPQFDQARLNEKFGTLEQQIRTVAAGTGNMGTALHGAKEEVSELVFEALRIGAEIPASMRPYIEELARSGQLVDENGDALTDLSRINFGDPVVTALDNIVKRFEDFLTKIAQSGFGLGNTIPDNAARAGDAIHDFARNAVDDLGEVEQAVNDVIEMHSPTGLEGIIHYAVLGREALTDMADVAKTKLRELATVVGGVALDLDGLLEKVGQVAAARPGTIDDENDPFHGFATMPALISEQEAIARVNEFFPRFVGRSATSADLASLARVYGYGGSGQLVRDRFEGFLNRLSVQLIEGNLEGLSSGTGGQFRDWGVRGTPVVLHDREAVVPYAERAATARQWLRDDAGAQPMVNVAVYVALDPHTGKISRLTEADRHVTQRWLDEGALQVPQRVITARTR
jgi:hypothetical protein